MMQVAKFISLVQYNRHLLLNGGLVIRSRDKSHVQENDFEKFSIIE